jgi:hypothetical protein
LAEGQGVRVWRRFTNKARRFSLYALTLDLSQMERGLQFSNLQKSRKKGKLTTAATGFAPVSFESEMVTQLELTSTFRI